MAGERKLLVAVDFSPCSRAALDAAIGWASDLGASLVLVHAFSRGTGSPPGTDPAHPDPVTAVRMELRRDEAVELSTTWAAEARRRGIEVVPVARDGKPADAILEEARRHGAIAVVVGTHGRTALRRLALGSVAEAVVRRADRPVLVVPDRKAPHAD